MNKLLMTQKLLLINKIVTILKRETSRTVYIREICS